MNTLNTLEPAKIADLPIISDYSYLRFILTAGSSIFYQVISCFVITKYYLKTRSRIDSSIRPTIKNQDDLIIFAAG
jgi:hypothetical protein